MRLSHLILSLGWEGAQEYLAKLSPDEKKRYFAPQRRNNDAPPSSDLK
jgi:hypothetical protein